MQETGHISTLSKKCNIVGSFRDQKVQITSVFGSLEDTDVSSVSETRWSTTDKSIFVANCSMCSDA